MDVSASLMRRCSVATPLFSAADRTQTKAARRCPDQRLHPEACLYLQLTRELCGFDRPISPDSAPPTPNSPKNSTLSFIPACTHRQSYYRCKGRHNNPHVIRAWSNV